MSLTEARGPSHDIQTTGNFLSLIVRVGVATGLKLLKEVPLVKLEPRKERLEREDLVDTEKLMEEERERERSVRILIAEAHKVAIFFLDFLLITVGRENSVIGVLK